MDVISFIYSLSQQYRYVWYADDITAETRSRGTSFYAESHSKTHPQLLSRSLPKSSVIPDHCIFSIGFVFQVLIRAKSKNISNAGKPYKGVHFLQGPPVATL